MEKKRSSRFGAFWGCTRFPECTGTHSAHQKTGEPMGIPADAATKKARIKAHEAFDRLWKHGGPMTRDKAYRWMRTKLGLPVEKAHISMFDAAECEQLLRAVNDFLGCRRTIP